MAYKIVYLEDQIADSVMHALKEFGVETFHCKPTFFEDTLDSIKKYNPDLILMDFRLKESGGIIDAPAFAQYFRSSTIDDENAIIPIVLLSNDERIQAYYKDFTSHDLFDFSINKGKFSKELSKYVSLMQELIETYKDIKKLLRSSNHNQLNKLLNIPRDIEGNLDPRLFEQLNSKKNLTDVYMASSFILNMLVKPIGVLAGEDVLSARLGVTKDSQEWNRLCELLEPYKYTGCFSGTYKRWWAIGIESWWKEYFKNMPSLKRLKAVDRCKAIKDKFNLQIEPIANHNQRTWSLCIENETIIDPVEAFELIQDENTVPWLDKKYYSFDALTNAGDINKLKSVKDFDREKFKSQAEIEG